MTDAAVDPQLDYAKLKAEQNEIMREQAGGAWGPAGQMTSEERFKQLSAEYQKKYGTPAAFDEAVHLRIKRGIEVTALLRRTNTGPAKAKSKRRGGKVDIEAITEELLK